MGGSTWKVATVATVLSQQAKRKMMQNVILERQVLAMCRVMLCIKSKKGSQASSSTVAEPLGCAQRSGLQELGRGEGCSDTQNTEDTTHFMGPIRTTRSEAVYESNSEH